MVNNGVGVIDARLVRVSTGSRGAGWAIGTEGVITARHVIMPFLEHIVDYCLAVPDPRPEARAFDCTVVWEDQSRDLAILAVKEEHLEEWAAAVGRDTDTRLAEPGTDPLDVVAVGYPNATLEDDFPHPEQVPGTLRPAGGAVSGLMPLDVDGSVPKESALWKGMSGAAACKQTDNGLRLVGVVVQVDQDRQHRRLYVRALPDPSRDAGFSAALEKVGARPVLEASTASKVQRLLTLWDDTGRPCRVGQVIELKEYGVRPARADVNLHGNPYYPYVERSLDMVIASALDRRVEGRENRILLLVGDAMSGKSRFGSHALMKHPVLAGHPLLIPSKGADLRAVSDLAPAAGAVLWLDDLNTFRAGLDAGVVRYFQERPNLVVIATLRSELLDTFLDNPELRPVWAAIDDDTLVEKYHLSSEWSDEEQHALNDLETVIREKVASGLSLGEVLGAAEELQNRLTNAYPFMRKAVVFAAIDWARTGHAQGIPLDLAERLWPHYLSKREARRVSNRGPAELHDDFEEARRWATAPICDTATMLLTQVEGHLRPEDYLVAHPPHKEIPKNIWRAALSHAIASDSPPLIETIAYNASMVGVSEIAVGAWEFRKNGTSPAATRAQISLGTLRFGRRPHPYIDRHQRRQH